MANIFKSSHFENIIKKYTLCVLCDGKVTDSSFLQCGCGVILCTYCNEKHICKSHHQAVKFNSYNDNKSIDFIYQLSALMATPSEKDKEKKGLLENSYSPSLPDFDDLMVDETMNSELSFSQLFDGRCSRTEKPRQSIGSLKRESISPRISYSLKRKQYLSDSDDEDIFNKSESALTKRLSDCSSSSKKKMTKKMKYSNKNRDTSIGSEIGYESESVIPDKQPLEKKRRNRRSRHSDESESVNPDKQLGEKKRRTRKTRHSLPEDKPSEVVNDVSTLNEVSMCVPESYQTVHQDPNVSVDDKTHVKNNSDTENNESYFQELVKKKNINNIGSRLKKVSDDELCASNVDESEIRMSHKVDDNEITTSDVVNINGENPVVEQSDEKLEVCSNNWMKQDKPNKHSKVSKRSNQNEASESDKQMKHKDNHNIKDFDGFDQCDINASTLNCILYKLTTPPRRDIDEMTFPIFYKGKTLVIHLTDEVGAKTNENEHHYILKPFKTFRNRFVQTSPEDKAIGITQTDINDTVETGVGEDGGRTKCVQTDSIQVVDACVGGDGEKTSCVQTDGYTAVDASVGGDGEKTSCVQTDSYRTVDACIGSDGQISKFSQTDGYQVMDSYTNTKDFRSCCIQTEMVNNSSSDLWSKNCSNSAVQADLHTKKPSDISSGMPYSNVKLQFPSSDVVRNDPTSEITEEVTADTNETSDNEDEDIIEGTPIKVNNLSLASLNLSAVKECTFRFDWNESKVARNEIVSCSDLASADKLSVQKFTKCFGMEYSEYFNNKTTHLVVSSRLCQYSQKTFKYLIAIASKACIVSIDWVKDSLKSKEVLPAEKYIPTNQPGPMRCRMNGNLPFAGLAINVQLMVNYPGVKAMEALIKLCGAYVVEDIERYDPPQKWPFPRFCLFEDESQLTSQILNNCSKNQIMAVNYEWVFDSVSAYCRQPIPKHLCSTFILSDEIVEKYKIPSDMLVDDCSQ